MIIVEVEKHTSNSSLLGNNEKFTRLFHESERMDSLTSWLDSLDGYFVRMKVNTTEGILNKLK
jgi:uncharacterized protein YdcH (DUF465 family)